MNRREFLRQTGGITLATVITVSLARKVYGDTPANLPRLPDNPKTKDWLTRWERRIIEDAGRSRYCDKEMGEELGWLMSPFLNGFYYGHLATGDAKWADLLVEWTDAWLKRAVTEPDGFPGWPKTGEGGGATKEYSSDSLLGEAMALCPVVLMSREIQKTPALEKKWGAKAAAYLEMAGRIFEKWNSRNCWREVKEGGLWIVPAFGLDLQSGKWTDGYAQRKTAGFSNPDNKQNHIARWLLAMHDATQKPVYKERVELWFRLMRSRMKTREQGKYFIWNYWEPAGPWDYQADGSTRHWVGVHPNGGYYGIDLEGIVAAYEHGLAFSREDINRLIATNRDFMWNQQMSGAKFQRIDGGEPDPRWKDSPGVLWNALVPYDETLRNIFIENHDPASWGGLEATPWFVSLQKNNR
ncbi:MAG: hypothetical protein JWQ04_538 [Pedosphaera sp.]|nr:hypothetical protein [Pedosphaera sp.]